MTNLRSICVIWICAACAGFAFLSTVAAQGTGPVRIIFDTDLGNDVDDALALAVAHALQNRGECQILAVTITKDNQYAAPMACLLNTFYGRPNIPIGIVHDGVTPDDGKNNKQVVLTKTERGGEAFPCGVQPGNTIPDAVTLLRKTLAAEEDGSVVVVQVGFSTNFARLMETGPDAVSPLSGLELIQKKVRLLSIMAGIFGPGYTHVEYNIDCDLPSAKKLIADWPTPAVFSGFEIGDMIQYPAVNIRNDFNYIEQHPLKEAYHYYRGLENSQPTFDLTSVLYAVRPDHGYFDLSEPGTVILDENGHTTFKPDANGKHRYMKVSATQIAKVQEALTLLCSEPPKR